MTSPRLIAAKNGQRRYEGKPCKVCGNTEKYVINASCVACAKQASNASKEIFRQHLQQSKETV